jgi:hypothetical protein
MSVKLHHLEELVHLSVAKPLAWALYGCGVLVTYLALASFRGIRWLIREKGSQRDRLQRREETCRRRL